MPHPQLASRTGGFAHLSNNGFVNPNDAIEEAVMLQLDCDDFVYPFQMPYLHTQPGYQNIFTGFKGLIAVSFLDGIAEIRLPGTTKEQRKLKQAAIKWVRSSGFPLSFDWYCDMLRIHDVERARQILLTQAGALS